MQLSKLRTHVGQKFFGRGRHYFLLGKVSGIKQGDGFIEGRVKGSQSEPYKTSITLKNGEVIDSKCTCPMGGSCKHVAALGIASISKTSLTSLVPTKKLVEKKKQNQVKNKWKKDRK